jgi:hypothetical protein
VHELICPLGHAEPERDDAAGRGARNRVEIIGDRFAAGDFCFDVREDAGRIGAAYSAAVERQDAIRLVGRPRQPITPRPK